MKCHAKIILGDNMKKLFNLILIFIFMLTINVKADRVSPSSSCFLQEYGKDFSYDCIHEAKESYTYNATTGSVIYDLDSNTLTLDNYQGPGIGLNKIDDNSTFNIIIKGEVVIDSSCTVGESCSTYMVASSALDIVGTNVTTIIKGYDVNSSIKTKNAYYNISVNGDVTIENLHGEFLAGGYNQGGIYPVNYTNDLTIKNSTLSLGGYFSKCDHLDIDNSSINYRPNTYSAYTMLNANSTKITNSIFTNELNKGTMIYSRSGEVEIKNNIFNNDVDNSSGQIMSIATTDNATIEDNTFSVTSISISLEGDNVKSTINNNYFASTKTNTSNYYLIVDKTKGETEITDNVVRYNCGGFFSANYDYQNSTKKVKKLDNNDLILNGNGFTPLYFSYVNLEFTNNKIVSTNTIDHIVTYSVGMGFDSLNGLKTGGNDIVLNGKYEKGIYITGCKIETIFENDKFVVNNAGTGLYVDSNNYRTIFDNVDFTINSNNVYNAYNNYNLWAERLVFRNSKLTIIDTDDTSAGTAAIVVDCDSFTAENSEIYIKNKYNSDIGQSNKIAFKYLGDWGGGSFTFTDTKVVVECDGSVVVSYAFMGKDSLNINGDYDFLEEGITFDNGLYDKDGKNIKNNLTIDKIYFYDNIVINPDKVNEDTETLSVMINGNNKNFTSIEISDLELVKDTDYTVEGERKTVISFTEAGIAKLNSLPEDTYEATFNYSNDKKVLGNIIIERLYTYLPIEGDNKSVVNKLEEFSFRIDGKFDLFDNIEINGLELVKDVDYTAKEGSTIIEFTESGLTKLNTLGAGEHNIKVNYTNGEQSNINFEITLPDINNPQTGDNFIIYILLSFISFLSMITIKAKRA